MPASGYYEWRLKEAGRQPYRIALRTGALFAFAGLWERWSPEGGEPLETFAIITTRSNKLLSEVHDRMPAILAPVDVAAWLGGARGTGLLQPAAEDRLRMWPVSRRVNRTGAGDDDQTLLDEVAVAQEPEAGGPLL